MPNHCPECETKRRLVTCDDCGTQYDSGMRPPPPPIDWGADPYAGIEFDTNGSWWRRLLGRV